VILDRELTMQPVGWVAKGRLDSQDARGTEQSEAEIEIDAAWADALDGIEGFSHIWVIWWLDRSREAPASPRVHPEGRSEMPLVGLFATRSPRRPNPVGLTCVRLLERRGQRLLVQGLDAFEGTPVLDIKPYLRRGDRIADATMPPWLERLWTIHDHEGDGQSAANSVCLR
jgi:tRNA-Thr(GGU) m(6)t(6)A37 methyltransferase TsaA